MPTPRIQPTLALIALSGSALLSWASDNPLDRHLPGTHAAATEKHPSPPHGHDSESGHAPADKPPKKAMPGKPSGSSHGSAAPASSHAQGHGGLSPEASKAAIRAAVTKLKEGNERYVTGNAAHPRQNRDRRGETGKGQKPFALVVACADSRVSPELVFDQGLGDVFVIRVAGQVIDNATLGSIEYAVEHLHVPLILVLGHERCGAVDAACKKVKADSHIRYLVEAISPAVAAAQEKMAEAKGGDLLDHAIAANVQRVMDELGASWPVLAPRARQGTLAIIGGVYDLDTGLVSFTML